MGNLELFNEYCILTSCVLMQIYSDGLLVLRNPWYPQLDEAVNDVRTKEELGWCNIGLLGVLICTNLVIMIGSLLAKIFRALKLGYLKRKQKKLIAEFLSRRRENNKLALKPAGATAV